MNNNRPFIVFAGVALLIVASFWGLLFFARYYEGRASGESGRPLAVKSEAEQKKNQAAEAAKKAADETKERADKAEQAVKDEAKEAKPAQNTPQPTPKPAPQPVASNPTPKPSPTPAPSPNPQPAAAANTNKQAPATGPSDQNDQKTIPATGSEVVGQLATVLFASIAAYLVRNLRRQRQLLRL